jgi:hypothetical protein
VDKLLSGIGTTLAARWINLLALPGVLFTIVLAVAWWLHPVDPLDLDALARRLDEVPTALPGLRLALLAAVGAVVATAFAGIAVELGRLIGLVWTGRGEVAMVLSRRLLRRRIRKSRAAAPPGHDVPKRYRPARATRIGDHLWLTEQRIAAQYGVALVRLWPRLWQLADTDERAMTQLAWDRYTAAALRAAWSVGYVLLGLLWWPCAVAGLLLYLSAVSSARRAAAALGLAIEALVDTKLLDLATALGIKAAHGRFTPADGNTLETVLDKGSYEEKPTG